MTQEIPAGTTSTGAAAVKQARLRNFLKRLHIEEWLLHNPIIAKELRGRMRGRRAFITLTFYVALIGLFIGLTYILVAEANSYSPGWDPDARQAAGKAVFSMVVLLQLLMATIIGPSLTTGAISSERERQTLDLLRTTLLPARSLVLGKLFSAAAFMLLMMVAVLPVESLAFFLGGVGLGEFIASGVMLVVTALAVCALGVFYSTFLKRTQGASVASYVTIFASFILLALVFLIEIVSSSFNDDNLILMFFLWLTLSINPLSAAIASETFLIEDQSLFLVELPINTSNTLLPPQIMIPSPWIIYSVIHLALTVLFIALSIRRLNRPDR